MDSYMKPLNPNKHLKEQFVSSLSGSSELELFALSAIFPMLILLRHTTGICKIDHITNETSSKKNNASEINQIITMILDFLSIVLPITLFCTISILFPYKIKSELPIYPYKSQVLADWTYTNGVILILLLQLTCNLWLFIFLILCITQLIVRLNHAQLNPVLAFRAYVSSYRVSMMLITCICILAVDFKIFPRRYAKTETYGTSLMDLGVGAFVFANSFISRQARGYQVCLMSGLNAYLLPLKRGTDIISQNKEGIYSIFGYWGLHLIGVWLGNNLLFGKKPNLGTNKQVWIPSIFFWCLTLILDYYVERPSRRMCNLTYVTLILATNLHMLAIMTLSDYIPGGKVSLLEKAINRNLLAFFIVANLMTGLVNLRIDTIFVSPMIALFILISYSFVICAAAAFVDYNGINLKFW